MAVVGVFSGMVDDRVEFMSRGIGHVHRLIVKILGHGKKLAKVYGGIDLDECSILPDGDTIDLHKEDGRGEIDVVTADDAEGVAGVADSALDMAALVVKVREGSVDGVLEVDHVGQEGFVEGAHLDDAIFTLPLLDDVLLVVLAMTHKAELPSPDMGGKDASETGAVRVTESLHHSLEILAEILLVVGIHVAEEGQRQISYGVDGGVELILGGVRVCITASQAAKEAEQAVVGRVRVGKAVVMVGNMGKDRCSEKEKESRIAVTD